MALSDVSDLLSKGSLRALVFDSGVGGLTVAQELQSLAPELPVDYAADTGFFPYGDKSDAALQARLPKVAKALVTAARPDVFVIACNTASTLALEGVRRILDIPVVGTVPAIKPAATKSQTGVIGLLATPGTVRRAYTDRLITEFAAKAQIIRHGSVELVALAEAVARGEAPPLSAFAAAQAPLFAAPGGERIDTVVLACTHFPLIRDHLIRTAPRTLTYIDSGAAIARQTVRVLGEVMPHTGPPAVPRGFITSPLDKQSAFAEILRRFGFPSIAQVEVAVDTPDAA